jgi:hypothetical protein
MTTIEQANAGDEADILINTEVDIQDRMWGDANERADSTNNQLLLAGIAQLTLTRLKLYGNSPACSTDLARLQYPDDWDGFRDYGSTVANLVVAAAFIRSEIKRRILLGEDTTRSKRDKPYKTATPYVSSEQAAAELL